MVVILPLQNLTEEIIVEVIIEVEEVEDFQVVEEVVTYLVALDVEHLSKARNGFLKDKRRMCRMMIKSKSKK